MMMRSVLILTTACWLFASACRQEPAPPADQGPSNGPATARADSPLAVTQPSDQESGKPNGKPGTRVYNTGDSDVWPSYDLPLVIQIEVPEVPENIRGPFPGDPGAED